MRCLLQLLITEAMDFRNLYKTIVSKTKQVFQTENDIILLTASGTGAVEASVINMIRKGDKVVVPVNGEFGNRLADLIDAWGGHAIRVESELEKIHVLKPLKRHLKRMKSRLHTRSTMKLPLEQPYGTWKR